MRRPHKFQVGVYLFEQPGPVGQPAYLGIDLSPDPGVMF